MTLTLATLPILLATTVLFIAVCILVYRQVVAPRRPNVPANWTPEFSVDRYRPMFRLLEDDDIRFLRSQPGATSAMVKRLRRQRYQVFRGYLRSLELDFHLALAALMAVVVHSPSERRDLLRALVVSRLKFSIGVFRVRCRLFLYRWNIGHEPVARLVSLCEGLQLELLALAPSPDGAVIHS
jgi:hypothetical protein